MSFKNPLLFFTLATTLSLVSAGVELEREVKGLIIGRLNKVALSCSDKGVPIGDIEPKISACIEEFNRLGAQKLELPPRPDYDDEEAYLDYMQKRGEIELNSICSQVNTTLDCLQPLKTITEECKSSEGITMFKFMNMWCQNNGLYLKDINIDMCGTSREVQTVFQSCGQGNGPYQNYGGISGLEASSIFEDLCGFGRAVRECILPAVQAGSAHTACQESSRNLNNFIEQLRTGSEAEAAAVTACLF